MPTNLKDIGGKNWKYSAIRYFYYMLFEHELK